MQKCIYIMFVIHPNNCSVIFEYHTQIPWCVFQERNFKSQFGTNKNIGGFSVQIFGKICEYNQIKQQDQHGKQNVQYTVASCW